jgi:hypothetical protein
MNQPSLSVAIVTRLLSGLQIALQNGAFNRLQVQDHHALTGAMLEASHWLDAAETPPAPKPPDAGAPA